LTHNLPSGTIHEGDWLSADLTPGYALAIVDTTPSEHLGLLLTDEVLRRYRFSGWFCGCGCHRI